MFHVKLNSFFWGDFVELFACEGDKGRLKGNTEGKNYGNGIIDGAWRRRRDDYWGAYRVLI